MWTVHWGQKNMWDESMTCVLPTARNTQTCHHHLSAVVQKQQLCHPSMWHNALVLHGIVNKQLFLRHRVLCVHIVHQLNIVQMLKKNKKGKEMKKKLWETLGCTKMLHLWFNTWEACRGRDRGLSLNQAGQSQQLHHHEIHCKGHRKIWQPCLTYEVMK